MADGTSHYAVYHSHPETLVVAIIIHELLWRVSLADMEKYLEEPDIIYFDHPLRWMNTQYLLSSLRWKHVHIDVTSHSTRAPLTSHPSWLYVHCCEDSTLNGQAAREWMTWSACLLGSERNNSRKMRKNKDGREGGAGFCMAQKTRTWSPHDTHCTWHIRCAHMVDEFGLGVSMKRIYIYTDMQKMHNKTALMKLL